MTNDKQPDAFKDAQWQQAGWISSWIVRHKLSAAIAASPTAFGELQDHLASFAAPTPPSAPVQQGVREAFDLWWKLQDYGLRDNCFEHSLAWSAWQAARSPSVGLNTKNGG